MTENVLGLIKTVVERGEDSADGKLQAQRSSRDLASCLVATRRLVSEYVAFRSPHQAVAVTLWIAHAHAVSAADATAYLAITSPEKRSGKSRLLDVLELLVPQPWRAVLPTEATLYRVIAARNPTLLLDELDAAFGQDREGRHEGLRAALNAGHRRGSTVPRCVPPSMEVRDFETFGAKALAAIGLLPDTVADRSIVIRLARRRPDEEVRRFRYREAQAEAASLRDALAQWASQALETLRDGRPSIPEALNDRAADGWEPLLAIADLAGGSWPTHARAAAIALDGDEDATDASVGVLLLEHLRRIFEETEADKLSTAEVVEKLVSLEEGPWAGWWSRNLRDGDTRGPGSRLARLLKPFDVRPVDVRQGDEVRKGYRLDTLEEAFSRYLPRLSRSQGRYNATAQVDVTFRPVDAHEAEGREMGSDLQSRVVASGDTLQGGNTGHPHGEPDPEPGPVTEQLSVASAVEWLEREMDAQVDVPALIALRREVEVDRFGVATELHELNVPPPPGHTKWTAAAVLAVEEGAPWR